ncbi:DUF2249 domain-containing protein [Sulfoacidibacillus ferrooxidans]|uniref:DUF2249 domain-containing protein n=1 Tax=Sulfoacidibacillus ferrooxidans TaxID=2005001 RepID=A0A9X1VB77_9BACL|nr:DUF2249 domain-containing protein [Sulfoacidibacillus ferrooxidans]MCI0184487.1 hypothetical protein [Sulfoacidibacillus ferrooxidans]
MTRRLVELDVRPMLQAREEPFARIMEAVQGLKGNDVLQLHATFLPEPLIRVMSRQGLSHCAVQMSPEHFIVDFYRDDSKRPYKHLDNRGLEPPQPMTRTLECLEGISELQNGDIGLEIWNDRVPAFLLPELDETGWVYEIYEEDDIVRVRIDR